MAENNEESQPTHEGRTLRLQILTDEIKRNKRMLLTDIIKFGMNKWWLSYRVVDIYIKELVARGTVTLKSELDADYVEYIEEGAR